MDFSPLWVLPRLKLSSETVSAFPYKGLSQCLHCVVILSQAPGVERLIEEVVISAII